MKLALTLMLCYGFIYSSYSQNQPEDRKKIDALVTSLYSAISFDRNQSPEYDRLKSIYHNTATVGMVDTAKISLFTAIEFQERSRKGLQNANAISFKEIEINNITHVYGGVAMRFSTYEFLLELPDQEIRVQGINTIQLIKEPTGDWRILSVVYSDNFSYPDVPLQYLGK